MKNNIDSSVQSWISKCLIAAGETLDSAHCYNFDLKTLGARAVCTNYTGRQRSQVRRNEFPGACHQTIPASMMKQVYHVMGYNESTGERFMVKAVVFL